MCTEKINLFVYGSLRDPAIFKSVTGLSFTLKSSRKKDSDILTAEPAMLSRYRKVSPDNVYFYAIADPSAKIEGFIIYDIPQSKLSEFDRYEGKRYGRETVHVNTAGGDVAAQAYLASHEVMKKHFGDRFHVNLRHELWLRKRIEKFLEEHTRPGDETEDARIERRAERELLAATERDLVISHYRNDAVSDYYLEHELKKPKPTIKHLYEDSEAQPFIENYLELVIKQVILNQLDEMIQSTYRYELDHIRTSERYFKRSVSLFIALHIININSKTVGMILDEAIEIMPYKEHDLFDYIKYAVKVSENFFDKRIIHSNLVRIQNNFQAGLIPMGAELELSGLGPMAAGPTRPLQKGLDSVYNEFGYFNDFCLDTLCWKLGGYIDDHTGSVDRGKKFGFLELAPGRLNIVGELSRPATASPWLLNQLIHEITSFYNVPPHSLHLSFQLRKNQIKTQKTLPLGFVKCLLALGGGSEQKRSGGAWVSRMGCNEMIQFDHGEELSFARTSKRNWFLGTEDIGTRPPSQATTYVHQYKFIRLDRRANYEPLILCLKGLQMSYNPAEYLTAEQLRASPKLRKEYQQLKEWSADPYEISASTIGRFLNTVQKGLMQESHGKPAHNLHYINWALGAIDVQLRLFNKQVKRGSVKDKG